MTISRVLREVVKRTPLIRRVAARARTACLRYGVETRRRDLLGHVSAAFGTRVQAGPFTGMELLAESSWSDSDRLPKLLGTYEAQLHPVIEAVSRYRSYTSITNIGCAEGYYAVGLARSMPFARVNAFDISQSARRLCTQAADRNGVKDRVSVSGECTVDVLRQILKTNGRCLLALDCEGAEADLLRPDLIPQLENADILVECHDLIRVNITSRLIERFTLTHHIWQIEQKFRSPQTFPALGTLTEMDQLLATCEFRAGSMYWLFCLAKHGEADSLVTEYLSEQLGRTVQAQTARNSDNRRSVGRTASHG